MNNSHNGDSNRKMGVLGCGNMASALVLGMKDSSIAPDFYCYTPTYKRAESLAETVNGSSFEVLKEMPVCDYFLIACKPHQVQDLARSFVKAFPNFKGVLISILAGVKTVEFQKIFNCKNILRLMPNTPALVSKGVIASYFTTDVRHDDRNELLRLFREGSKVFEFKMEDDLDKITPYSGSGPGLLFEVGRIMSESLVSLGIDENISKQMIAETFLGTGKLMSESDESFEILRNNVTSKNGVTDQALKTLERLGLESIFNKALEDAYNKTKDLI